MKRHLISAIGQLVYNLRRQAKDDTASRSDAHMKLRMKRTNLRITRSTRSTSYPVFSKETAESQALRVGFFSVHLPLAWAARPLRPARTSRGMISILTFCFLPAEHRFHYVAYSSVLMYNRTRRSRLNAVLMSVMWMSSLVSGCLRNGRFLNGARTRSSHARAPVSQSHWKWM